jgi:hypothetical protein
MLAQERETYPVAYVDTVDTVQYVHRVGYSRLVIGD